ncbi:MAG: class 1 fructose-bisphosphatase [Caldilineaceae bacterium]|nr:class 1 fructose-bisphosphatase [Caldilineaceae bacterium]
MATRNGVTADKIITIERFIFEQQLQKENASGELTGLLYDLALSAKFIASQTNRIGLAEILNNVDADYDRVSKPQPVGQYAERIIHRLNDHTGRLAVMSSEEQPHIIPIPDRYPTGNYVLIYDPLDGVSNIDYNVSIGTIFAIYRRVSQSGRGTLEDCLQTGSKLVAAGYVVYGSSTMLVYSTGQGVHGFTLDPIIGEFLLSHPNIRYPQAPQYYSVNQGYWPYWPQPTRDYTTWLQGEGKRKPLSLRYIGSLVADFHRNLLAGGVFYYPADSRDAQLPHGRLHLVYEAAPLAFLAQQAGGYGSDGCQPILDIQPAELDQRTPFYVGNRELIEKAEEFLRQAEAE